MLANSLSDLLLELSKTDARITLTANSKVAIDNELRDLRAMRQLLIADIDDLVDRHESGDYLWDDDSCFD